MERNELYPVFLKVNNLNVLIVGGGNVGLEKLTFLLKSSPNAQVQMVAPEFLPETLKLAGNHNVEITKDVYQEKYLEGKHMVVACTDKPEVNEQVYHDCRKLSKLVKRRETDLLMSLNLTSQEKKINKIKKDRIQKLSLDLQNGQQQVSEIIFYSEEDEDDIDAEIRLNDARKWDDLLRKAMVY